jgi:molybdopterin-guanine dinucleotide biosynthesis protein A
VNKALTVVVLAGGHSRRMGRDKALLPLGASSLLQRVMDVAAPLSDQRLLVTNSPASHAAFAWPQKADIAPDKGPLGGLYTALTHSKTDHLLLLACDLPYLSTPFLRFLYQQIDDEHQAFVPDSPAGLQPLCAIYNRSILASVGQAIDLNQLGMRRLLATLNIRAITAAQWQPYDPEDRLFTNLNTPEDYQRTQ